VAKRRKLVLAGTNEVEIELDGVEIKISGPAEHEWVREADLEGLVPDADWELRSIAVFFRVIGITPRDDGTATLEIARLAKSGRPMGASICLEGVSYAEAVELQDRLRALAEAEAVEVPVDQLFADPSEYHGRKIRLEWVGAEVKHEGNRLWTYGAPDPMIWHDLELLPGSYEVVVEGVLLYDPDRGFGHGGLSHGELTVTRLLDSRATGETLSKLVREQVFDLVRARWGELVAPALGEGWRPALSPPFPVAWPPDGQGALVYYSFASSAEDCLGLQLAEGQRLGSVWAGVLVDALGQSQPALVSLPPTAAALVADVGASGGAPEALQVSESWLEAAGETAYGAVFRASRSSAQAVEPLDATRTVYAAWLACFAPVSAIIRERHPGFVAWVEGR
jgi:hypothetical protein